MLKKFITKKMINDIFRSINSLVDSIYYFIFPILEISEHAKHYTHLKKKQMPSITFLHKPPPLETPPLISPCV